MIRIFFSCSYSSMGTKFCVCEDQPRFARHEADVELLPLHLHLLNNHINSKIPHVWLQTLRKALALPALGIIQVRASWMGLNVGPLQQTITSNGTKSIFAA